MILEVKATSVANTSKSGIATVTVTNLPQLTGSVYICGDQWENAVLAATPSTDGSGTAAFQWRRNGNEIPGATNGTYTVANADRG